MIDVRGSETFEFLTKRGKQPVLCDNGKTNVPVETLVEQANAICALLAGRGYTYNQIYMILMVAGNAFRDVMDREVKKAKLTKM